MKALLIAVFALLLNACTMYDIKKEIDPNTGVASTDVSIKSTRDIEQPNLHYERVGNDAVFDFKAAGVDNNTDAFVGMFQGMMGMLSTMMETMMLNMHAMQTAALKGELE